MTTDNSRYEEAAKQHLGYQPDEERTKDFLAGASFAEKEKALEYKLAIETAAILREQRDEALDKLEAVEKEARHTAIDKAIEIVQIGAYSSASHLARLLEKLKI